MTETLDSLLASKESQRREVVNVDEPMIKLVIFRLGERCFAFPGEVIREVLPGDEPVFFVPGMPSTIEGVINVRGDIESVILLQRVLQLSAATEPASGPRASILLGQGQQMHSGLRVDRLLDVVDVPQSLVQPPPDSLPEHLRECVTGLLSYQQLAITLLDLDQVFAIWERGSS